MLRSLNIRKRLSVVYGLFALVIVVIGGFGAYSMKAVEERFQQYAFHVVEAAQYAGLIRTGMATLRRYEKDIVISVGDAGKVKEYVDLWEATYKAVEKDFGELERRLRDDKVKQNVATARAGIKTYHDNIAAALPQLEGADVPTANQLMRAGRDGYVQADKIFEETLSLVQSFTERVKKAFADALGTVLMVTGALTLLSIAGMLVLGRAISGSIVVPLRKAQDFAEQVREGDLTGELSASGQDETGQLSRSLADMQGSLQTIVGQVRMAADSISTASSEVASGNQDLSHRTEQTAASLQQTASAMNQLTATVNQTADAARTASQLASQASTSAERGGAVVSEVVSTMETINQSSRRIADIIGTIDGIAFQTNILALNAAVEAARAGEQGRGFAVVAGEVRSLAQRSAEAAKEIKSLISASVESVDNGTRLVADAGSTMTEIVGNVQRVTDIIGEISAAAGEQSAGIGNVNQSVAQLDQATQQNAALVEESAAAAQSLRDQAQKLAEVVATFRLPGHAAVRAAPRSTPSPAAPSPAPRAAPAKPRAAAPVLKKAAPATPAAAAPRPAPSPAPAPAAADDDWETF